MAVAASEDAKLPVAYLPVGGTLRLQGGEKWQRLDATGSRPGTGERVPGTSADISAPADGDCVLLLTAGRAGVACESGRVQSRPRLLATPRTLNHRPRPIDERAGRLDPGGRLYSRERILEMSLRRERDRQIHVGVDVQGIVLDGSPKHLLGLDLPIGLDKEHAKVVASARKLWIRVYRSSQDGLCL